MRVGMNDRELIGVYDYMRGQVWGGPSLLDQLELWDAFGLDTRFAAIKGGSVDLSKLSDESTVADLSAGAVAVLREVLTRPGQPLPFARHAGAVLKRLV